MTMDASTIPLELLAAADRDAGVGRELVTEYLEKHLVGPFDGIAEVVEDVPNRRYLMATLYPAESDADAELEGEERESSGASVKDDVIEDPVAQSNSWMPSSIGLSFYVSGESDLRVSVWGARYEQEGESRRQSWKRVSIAERDTPQSEIIRAPKSGLNGEPKTVLDGRAVLTSYWRQFPGGFLVTVVLMNAQMDSSERSDDGDRRVDPSLCLHQVGLECSAIDGAIVEYPSVDVLNNDPEDEELRVLHRKARVFAIGHGCAANWKEVEGSKVERQVNWVRSTHLPVFEVPALTHEGPGDADVLSIGRLADKNDDPSALIRDLRSFVARYEQWIKSVEGQNADISPRLTAAVGRLLGRLGEISAKLHHGIDSLESDPLIFRTFRLANLAMLMQMKHSAKEAAGTRRRRGEGAKVDDNYLERFRRWRPFQLAYVLLCIPSIAHDQAPDRDLVELLWFPTGGGKTEAYLTLAAFQILLRRLRSGDRGAGTTVITRYTLRLLTAQQFQRATTVICALEILRRRFEAEMGSEPVSIGLWVGEDQTPNDLVKARELLEAILQEERPLNKFQVDQCPWCGTEILPLERVNDESVYGIRIGNQSFTMFCPSPACEFHDKLPISVVDEDLYRSPPTLLLATVDKFARLAWVEQAVAFFGGGKFEPPSLIIQDEMHLLSGPLGTTVAVYEGAIEALATFHGARPKILASTATIRNANQQVRGLFGREVRVFPPSGLSADDSYFATTDKSRRGRLYVGVMAQSHTPQTTTVHTTAALLQAPWEVQLTKAERDSYWTVVAYHNSIRELGRTATLARDDIPSRIEVIARDQSRMRQIDEPDVVELTSNVRGDELMRVLARLNIEGMDSDAISVLITTNMLSVGVDIPRLGVMLVNGQPKATSEYIQATSRVGRAHVPGLVVVMYNSTKPRDRSHYESFRSYHSALYRYVEPTSVTPFSLPSRERALHAALVILMRHGAGLSADDAAGRFDKDSPETRKITSLLLDRVASIDPGELAATTRHLERLAEEWHAKAEAARKLGRALYYKPAGKAHASLLRDFGSSGDAWPTLHSMRNIDRQCHVTVMGER